jgi:anti-sigma regulatory factor (Ser/Thr protein kinase)
MFEPPCQIRLSLPASAENVVLVRRVVATLAEELRLPRELVEDIKLAVTEACTNVVRHAYAGGEGSLEVELDPKDGERLTVVVTDHGSGIQPHPRVGGPGLGLPLIAALADQLEIDQQPDHGSRVCMEFRAAGNLETA